MKLMENFTFYELIDIYLLTFNMFYMQYFGMSSFEIKYFQLTILEQMQ
jgi:hypothetical protein